jgi:5-methylcytosine-specific restriction endonuclease McrA
MSDFSWDHDDIEEREWVTCACERGRYNPGHYSSCYDCFLERRSDYVTCIYCGRWHNPEYPTCFKCGGANGPRAEAAWSLRQYIVWRDDYTCCWCGDKGGVLQVDHIRPCRSGGDATPWNLQALCSECNRLKGSAWSPVGDSARRRKELLTQYFYWWRPLLDLLGDDLRASLRRDVDLIRSGADW